MKACLYWAILMLLLAAPACQPERRPGVYAAGFSPDSLGCPAEALRANAKAAELWNISTCMVTLNLETAPGRPGLSAYESVRGALDSLMGAQRAAGLQPMLQLNFIASESASPAEALRALPAWLEHAPAWIALRGADTLPATLAAWDELRRQWPQTRYIWTYRPMRQPQALAPWSRIDAVGIAMDAPAGESYGKYFRRLNVQAGREALRRGKMLWIIESNLLEQDRLRQLRFELRYWPRKLPIAGLVLNSVYCNTPIADSLSPFSLAQHSALRVWLQQHPAISNP